MANNFSANLVISAKGSILAVDIINGGSGYTSTPIISLNNPGGYGNGAVLVPIMEKDPDDTLVFDVRGCGNPSDGVFPNLNSPNNRTVGLGGGGYAARPSVNVTASLLPVEPPVFPEGKSISKFVVIDSGVGYLQRPNGATGGGGVKFSNPEDTIVFCGGYNVYPPCINVKVKSGNLVFLPFNTTGQIFNNDGDLVQTVLGLGPVSPITVLQDGILATPCIKREEVIPPIAIGPISPTTLSEELPTTPVSPSNTYEVVLEIGSIFIENTGINYSPNDVITIEPSNGAELEPVFDNLGRVKKVNVVRPGIGFTEFPKIRIYSDTGYNANIIPIFNVIRITNEVLDQDIVPPGTPLISVIDCVGSQPPKREFIRVSE